MDDRNQRLQMDIFRCQSEMFDRIRFQLDGRSSARSAQEYRSRKNESHGDVAISDPTADFGKGYIHATSEAHWGSRYVTPTESLLTVARPTANLRGSRETDTWLLDEVESSTRHQNLRGASERVENFGRQAFKVPEVPKSRESFSSSSGLERGANDETRGTFNWKKLDQFELKDERVKQSDTTKLLGETRKYRYISQEELIELLAQFYAYTFGLQEKLEKILNRIRLPDDTSRLESVSNQTVNHEFDTQPIETTSASYTSPQIKEHNSARKSLLSNDNFPIYVKSIKMKVGADDESLLRWLKAKQEKFDSLRNATIEFISEEPNKSINVCPDGPKILIVKKPDVLTISDIFYCYTQDQWIQKLWRDLRLASIHYPIIMLNMLIFLFGTTGNIFVCLSVYRNHQLRNVTNYYIVNLALADLLVIIICLPPTFIWDLSLTWFFGTLPCKLIMYLQVRHYLHIRHSQ